MSPGTHGLDKRWMQIFLACLFLVTCASAAIGQCVDNLDRRRKEIDPYSQPRGPLGSEICDPQLLPVPGIIHRPDRGCNETLPREQIKEDRAYLESLSQSVLIAAENPNELNLPTVSQWAGEVRKRVRRLQASLALPETESDANTSISEDAQIPSNRIDLARKLIVLSRLTDESLRNPVLRGFLLDQALSAKAVRDFKQIENLAVSIQTGCQLLSKVSR